MRKTLDICAARLAACRSAPAGRFAIVAQDDAIVSAGDREWAQLGGEILSRLPALALVVAGPRPPFAELLLRRTPPDRLRIVPRDTETRTFLHDIPILREKEAGGNAAERIAALLRARKGVVVEGIGIVATGPLSIEQAFVNYSCVFHATFVKYLLDILSEGFPLPGERKVFEDCWDEWLQPVSAEGLFLRPGPLEAPADVADEMAAVGRYTVELGLVDSFFGNVSYCAGGTIYISQTAASLDDLAGRIDAVPLDGSSTAGITASSELPAHRRIYETTGARAILHGHPKLAVVMSMLCEEKDCATKDCWKECQRARLVGDTPVVAGEPGAGGLADTLPSAIAQAGRALVFGHGVFTASRTSLAEAFRAMVEVENACRNEYAKKVASGTLHKS